MNLKPDLLFFTGGEKFFGGMSNFDMQLFLKKFDLKKL